MVEKERKQLVIENVSINISSNVMFSSKYISKTLVDKKTNQKKY